MFFWRQQKKMKTGQHWVVEDFEPFSQVSFVILYSLSCESYKGNKISVGKFSGCKFHVPWDKCGALMVEEEDRKWCADALSFPSYEIMRKKKKNSGQGKQNLTLLSFTL